MLLSGKYNVAEVFFDKFFLLSVFFFIQIEWFFHIYYSYVIFSIKTLKVKSLNNTIKNISEKNINKVYLFLTLIVLLTYKGGEVSVGFLIFITILFIYILNNFLELIFKRYKISGSIYLIIPVFSTFIIMLFLIDSFLVLFFFIEIYSVLYYFCFLISYNFTNQTVLKYKNGLLFLLWNNFLTSMFLVCGCFFFLKNCGTTNFIDLNYLSLNPISVYLFLSGLFWKLGLPIFHFFKLEVYKFLIKESVLLFSIITTLVNFILLCVVFSQSSIIVAIYQVKILLIILLITTVLIIFNLKINTFLQFFAYSSVFTLMTLLTIFLIYNWYYILLNITFLWNNYQINVSNFNIKFVFVKI